jgi:hypothetical protein
MEKKLLPYLVVISAISVSLSAAFYSVVGIGHMFSGSKMNVMIMMGSLEISKLILASLVYQYWDKLSLLLRTYYIIAISVLMLITSGGIYGYLANAYSDTKSKFEENIVLIDYKEGDIKSFSDKIEKLNIDKVSLNLEKSELNSSRTQLSSRDSKTQYKDKEGNIITRIDNQSRKSDDLQLSKIERDREKIDIKITKIDSLINNLVDSIRVKELEILSIKGDKSVSSEVGALVYISDLTGRTMDEVVNWFIFLLMLVFDPLAVSLVIGANIIFKGDKPNENDFDYLDDSEYKSKKESIGGLEKELSEKLSKKEELEKSLNELENIEREKVENILNLNQELTDISKNISDVKRGGNIRDKKMESLKRGRLDLS